MRGLGADTGLTASDLKSLRDRGLVPYSSFCTSCAAVIGAIVGLFQLRGNFDRLIALVKTGEGANESLVMIGGELQKVMITVMICVPLCAGAAALIVGMIQTKFLLRLSRAKTRQDEGFFTRILVAMGSTILAVILAIGAYFICLSPFTALVNASKASFSEFLPTMIERMIPLFALLCAGLGILSYLIKRWLFLHVLAPRYLRIGDSH